MPMFITASSWAKVYPACRLANAFRSDCQGPETYPDGLLDFVMRSNDLPEFCQGFNQLVAHCVQLALDMKQLPQ